MGKGLTDELRDLIPLTRTCSSPDDIPKDGMGEEEPGTAIPKYDGVDEGLGGAIPKHELGGEGVANAIPKTDLGGDGLESAIPKHDFGGEGADMLEEARLIAPMFTSRMTGLE